MLAVRCTACAPAAPGARHFIAGAVLSACSIAPARLGGGSDAILAVRCTACAPAAPGTCKYIAGSPLCTAVIASAAARRRTTATFTRAHTAASPGSPAARILITAAVLRPRVLTTTRTTGRPAARNPYRTFICRHPSATGITFIELAAITPFTAQPPVFIRQHLYRIIFPRGLRLHTAAVKRICIIGTFRFPLRTSLQRSRHRQRGKFYTVLVP